MRRKSAGTQCVLRMFGSGGFIMFPLDETKAFYTIQDLVTAGYGSRTTLWRERKSGELPSVTTTSGRVLIPRDEFLIYLHGHMNDNSMIR